MAYGEDVPEPTEAELAGAAVEHAALLEEYPAPAPHPFLVAMGRLDLQEDIDALVADVLRGNNPGEAYARLCRHSKYDFS